MTRHIRTNKNALEIAELYLGYLKWVLGETGKEIDHHREMMQDSRMSSVEKEFYHNKIEMFYANKPLIEADMASLAEARDKLESPSRTWSDKDESQIEKLCKEQRLIIARLADRAITYTARFLKARERAEEARRERRDAQLTV